MKIKRKTVIITGASQGIGAGIVQAFLARGYDLSARPEARQNRKTFQRLTIWP